MHPLVYSLIHNNQTIKDLSKDPHRPTDDLSKIIIEIILSYDSGQLMSLESARMKKRLRQLIKKANAINLNESPSAELTIIFLIYLSNLYSLLLANGENVFKTLNTATTFITDMIHPSVRAYLIYTLEYYRIQFKEGFASSKNKICKLQNQIKFKTTLDRAIQGGIFKLLADEGYLQAEDVLPSFEALSSSVTNKEGVLKIKFIDSVTRGDLEPAQKYLDQIPASERDLSVQENMAFLNFQKNNWSSISWGVAFQTSRKPWLQHFVLLHEGKAAESLRVIKSLIKENTISYSVIQETLLFAELANDHVESSLYLLKKYLAFNEGHYFNAFFQMYFELINHNYSMASKHYEDVSKACVKYKAEGKLDFYLNLAPNISPSDIRKMQREPKALKANRNVSDKSSRIDKNKDIIIGSSETTKEIIYEIKKYANLEVPILILGETGVGKDVVARNLHNQSKRNKQKFLPINCGAINDSLLQSELFGHVAGAFTGADKERIGVFEAAGKGTVFLDEFGEITPQLQIALLRILENKEVRPVGATETRPITCRILFATNANLQQLVDQKKFRKDLLFRINKLTLQIPPLRDRPEDILTLIQHYFTIEREDQKCPHLSKKLKEAFLAYPWPGNTRELKNEIEIARILNSEKSEYEVDDFKKLFASFKEANIVMEQPLQETSIPNKSQAEMDLKRALELRKFRSKSDQRIVRIKALFNSLDKVYRIDLVDILQVTPKTVTNDLKKLIKENYIKKVEPNSAPCSHYFMIDSSKK